MATFTVNNTNDRGIGSLRQAIANANGLAGLDTIEFANNLSGQTITLTSGELQITDDLTINGLGADFLTISGNNADRVFLVDDGTSNEIAVIIDGLTIAEGETGGNGGGIFNLENLMVSNSSIRNNSANFDGGGIGNNGTLTVRDSIVSDNSAGEDAGGLVNFGNGTLMLTNIIVSGNTAINVGGGIGNNGELIVSNSNVSNNRANANGGGVQNRLGTVNITGTTISNNSVNFNAGGISNLNGEFRVSQSLISDNSAGDDGGGFANFSNSFLIVANSTVSGNFANGVGGGIRNNGQLELSNSTITNNSANNYGGGVQNLNGVTTISNTIIAGNNGTNPDVVGEFNSEGYNLIGDDLGSTGFSATGDLFGTSDNPLDPLLGPLQNNGGSSLTHALLPGSPAIDAGDPDFFELLTPFDQRVTGFPRVLDGDRDLLATVDIGAFEFIKIIDGTIGDDSLRGTRGSDLMRGLRGNDTLNGRAGDDILLGNNHDDSLSGGNGDDTLRGGAGADILRGNAGDDSLIGGNGNDTLRGGAGADILRGNAGDDSLVGGNDNDLLRGGAGADILSGNADDDSLIGGNDNDTLRGGTGLDQLFGQAGNDRLNGGNGDDTLNGGTGRDILIGGSGSDRFFLMPGVTGDHDIIRDYQDGLDRLVLTNGLSVNDLTISQSGANTRIRETATNQTLAILNGITASNITHHDFEFGAGINGIRVEAEDYVNYHDTTAGNTGGAYRNDDVDLEVTTDVGAGFNVGWIADEEWLTYNVNLAESGLYQVVARVASATTDGRTHHLDVSLDGQSTSLDFNATGGWQSWTDISGGNLNLSAGSHELRLDMGSSDFNINYVDLIRLDNIRVEAENYTDYFDTTAGNIGGAYRNDDVDIEITTDIGGGFNVGWIDQGESLTYDVEIPEDGLYQVVARVASASNQAHHLSVSLDGQSTGLDFGATGGWQSWTDVVGENLELSAGSHELGLYMGSSGFNVNYVDLIPLNNSAITNFASDEILGNMEHFPLVEDAFEF
ncbi:MAG: carbohydrate-binding protein [Xenococcus sp. (in: cyanobacteria)]